MIGFIGEPPLGYKPRREFFPLRAYQEEAWDRWIEFTQAGGMAALIVLPTGTGKQWILAVGANRSGRTLAIAHRDILLEQPMATALKVLDRPDIGLVKAGSNELDVKNIVFASIQTISRPERLAQLIESHKKNPFSFIIVDECHRSSADSYIRVFEAMPEVPRLGLTATPVRSDSKGLAKIWGAKPIYRMKLQDAIDDGFLVEPLSRPARIDSLDLNRALARFEDGDFNDEELEKEMVRARVAEGVAEIVRKVIVDEGRKPIVFTASVNQAERIALLLRDKGVAAEAVSYLSTKGKKDSILADFKKGDIKVVLCAGLLAEGWDETSLNCVVMARPTFSPGFFTQCIGRGLRPHPGKNDCLIIDIVGATEVAGLVTMDNLDMDGEKKPRAKGADSQFVDPFGDAEFERIKSFANTAVEDLEERKKKGKGGRVGTKARAIWIKVNDLFWALSAGREGHLLLIKEDEGNDASWMGYQLKKDSWNLLERESICAKKTTQDISCGVVEDRARALGVFRLSSSDSIWRAKPPTGAQISILTAAGLAIPHTSGECADEITAMKMRKMWASYLVLRKHMVKA